jgi:hypothetical protein
MIALSGRVHTFARPEVKEALTDFFVRIFEARVVPVEGASIVVFRLGEDSSLSVEFTEDGLDEQQARRGPWLEVATDDSDGLRKKVIEAGLRQVPYLTGRFYFQAPGGQVWGILAAAKS